ncbi:MAG: type II secretion system major pseudopilin GspG [Planctomycetota bacterium]|nr:type II secretion system major pseudopilin GspG [Planctomycetota bacterium]
MSIRNRTKQAGFTLAELMVVIVIIGLLATLVTTDVMGIFSDAKVKKVQADIQTIDTAITNYTLRNGRAPDDLEILIQPDENNHRFLNKTAVPKDPWKNPYLYEPPVGNERYRIYSLGRDGSPGGEGEDRDISNIDMMAE